MATVRPGGGIGSVSGGVPRAGLLVLIPGPPQWVWGQRERGTVLLGSFAAGVIAAAFAWGTPAGLGLAGFAFLTHVVSALDVVRQSAFPGPGRWASLALAAGGLGAGVYAPLLTVASLVAWPGLRDGSPDGYLVNCWAYHRSEPRRDELVWYRPTPWGSPRVGRVVAGRGQEVAWVGGGLRVDGQPERPDAPSQTPGAPKALAYRVPEGHVLIRTEEEGSAPRATEGLTIVAREQIVGRAWLRFYPVRERRIL